MQTFEVLRSIVDGLDNAVDAKDWDKARAYFADRLIADFSSLTGQPASEIAADDLVNGWAGNLTTSKTSLHLRTNHEFEITGDRARVISHGYAWNRMEGLGDDPLWEVWGIYEHGLARQPDGGWLIDRFTFRMTHERGNLKVKVTPGG